MKTVETIFHSFPCTRPQDILDIFLYQIGPKSADWSAKLHKMKAT